MSGVGNEQVRVVDNRRDWIKLGLIIFLIIVFPVSLFLFAKHEKYLFTLFALDQLGDPVVFVFWF